MTCAGNNTVAALLAGAIDAGAAQRLELHLDVCATCRELVADLGRGLSAIGDDRGGRAGVGDRLPRAGEKVGRYTINRVIGVGGMGVVYEARDTTLDRRVAVKLLRPDLVEDTQLLAEAQAMARLQHANIAVVHDVGAFRGQLYLCMEYVDGTTLRAWLAERPRTWREIVRVFVAAGRGLAYVHAAGLVHLDFKPDNVLVARSGRVVVTDFGLARIVGQHHAAHLVVGTPAYMAPEQRRGAATDRRTDQYGFCAALREALGDQAPARVRRTIARGLAERPADRFASMDALLAALEPPRSRVRRHLAVALAAAAAVLAVAVSPAPRTIRELVDRPVVQVVRQPVAGAVAQAEPDEAAPLDELDDPEEPTERTPSPANAIDRAPVEARLAVHPMARPMLRSSFELGATPDVEPERSARADAASDPGRGKAVAFGCNDGTDRACAIDEPSCPPTTIAAIQNGCWTCADQRTCASLGLPHVCDDASRPSATSRPVECTGHEVASLRRGVWRCADPFACVRPSAPLPPKPAPPKSSHCGNGVCDAGEDHQSCPADCVTVCGNGMCEAGEDHASCAADCCVLSTDPSGNGSGSGNSDGGSGSGTSGGSGSGSGFDPNGNGSGSGNSDGSTGSGSGSAFCVSGCGDGICDPGEAASCPGDCCTLDPTTNSCL